LDLINNRLVANSMEPRNAVADYDPRSGRSTLYTATQGPHFVRDPLAEAVLKIPKEQLRVITPNVGGGFGMKAFVYPEQALVVLATGLYMIGAIHVNVKGVCTNTVPVCAYRGRRAARSRLSAGANRRRRSARAWHDAGRHPAGQFRAGFGHALH